MLGYSKHVKGPQKPLEG